ncbi:3-dehydrosphinganine reductase-like isoform X2 [Porites lutea]|uniref:3-dehydrosphinganine reductase-like isoform X2 n=1 Tax=Porites lutea TaxID=51062 RepID=UPI003CC695FD
MFHLLIFVIFIGVLGVLIFDFLSRKKTEINGAHVLVTGGSSGIGKAVAIKMARCGANVTILARNMDRLEETLKEVRKHLAPERKVLAFSVDLTVDAQDVENTIDQACESLGPVDILINCAGFAVCGLFEETTVDQFKFGIFGFSAYAASKFAVRGFAETLFMEVKPYNIGVSVVFPPDTDTPGFENENKGKPEETHLISSSGGLFTPDQVAAIMVAGIKNRKFLISCGFDGFAVKSLTCGIAPASSLFELLVQVALMGPLRLVLAFYLYHYDRIVLNGMRKREASKKRN